MISEYQAVTIHGRKVESRALADSGVQYVAAMLQQRFDFAGEDVLDNPGQLRDVLLTESDVARGRGRFSVVAPPSSSETSQSIRFGLTDESSKLNLNTIAQRVLADRLDEEHARAILLQLPGMTVETADATLGLVGSGRHASSNTARRLSITARLSPAVCREERSARNARRITPSPRHHTASCLMARMRTATGSLILTRTMSIYTRHRRRA